MPVLAVGAALLVASPQTEPPVEPAIVNAVTNFVTDHPEWAMLREERFDAARIKLVHATHMNPDTGQMHKRLGAAGSVVPAVARISGGRVSLTCASCHEQDDAGRYMKPIQFDRHCAACHTSNLPNIDGLPAPHGDMGALVDRLGASLAREYSAISTAHVLHLNPETARMQELLAAGVQAERLTGVAEDGQKRLVLTCASCHQLSDNPPELRAIVFEHHCIACHDEKPEERPTEFRAGTQSGEDLAASGDWSKSPRGAIGDSISAPGAGMLQEYLASSAVSQPRPKQVTQIAPKGLDLSNLGEVWLVKRRAAAYARMLEDSCTKCHTGKSITPPPPDSPGEPFNIAPPMIPDRWLDRSVFSHQSHRALTCLECHEQAATGRFTTDIMLPSIESCRQCHTPAAGVRSDCVMCHVYHAPLTPSPPGTITIEEYIGAGASSRP